MGDKTKIEWTDATWNPIRGCSVVSAGCKNCYAMQVAARFSGDGQAYEGLAYRNEGGAHWTGKIKLVEEHLTDPLRWKRPRRVFVNSMSDLFHPAVPDEWVNQIFEVMFTAKRHQFQVLTKRPERMYDYVSRNAWLTDDPLPNVWLGVSVEDQKTADERIPWLLRTPAAVRFVSAEPLLDYTVFKGAWLYGGCPLCDFTGYVPLDGGEVECRCCVPHLRDATFAKLDWVICGGESGPGARAMDPQSARKLRDQCVAAGVPFFFKQWGEWRPLFEGGDEGPACAVCGCTEDRACAGGCAWSSRALNMRDVCTSCDRVTILRFGPTDFARVGKKNAGRLLDGRTWDEMPEVVR